jgi:hypothetical protein
LVLQTRFSTPLHHTPSYADDSIIDTDITLPLSSIVDAPQYRCAHTFTLCSWLYSHPSSSPPPTTTTSSTSSHPLSLPTTPFPPRARPRSLASATILWILFSRFSPFFFLEFLFYYKSPSVPTLHFFSFYSFLVHFLFFLFSL